MGGSAKTPKTSANQQELEDIQLTLLRKQLDEAENPKPEKKIEIPKPLPPPPPPAQVSGDTEAAANAARAQAMRRTNTARRTLFAGETGGYRPAAKTLLG